MGNWAFLYELRASPPITLFSEQTRTQQIYVRKLADLFAGEIAKKQLNIFAFFPSPSRSSSAVNAGLLRM